MTSQEKMRTDFESTIGHIQRISMKVVDLTSNGSTFHYPDQHKISEGLFLSAWTYWEQYLRSLLIEDLATEPGGFVRKDVKKFRVKGAPRRLAERVLAHPDNQRPSVDWTFDLVKSRADDLLPQGHRFASISYVGDLEVMKRLRNAIAHKSDKAWTGFKALAQSEPFRLEAKQMRGITVGRLLSQPAWNGEWVLQKCLEIHIRNARLLVP